MSREEFNALFRPEDLAELRTTASNILREHQESEAWSALVRSREEFHADFMEIE